MSDKEKKEKKEKKENEEKKKKSAKDHAAESPGQTKLLQFCLPQAALKEDSTVDSLSNKTKEGSYETTGGSPASDKAPVHLHEPADATGSSFGAVVSASCRRRKDVSAGQTEYSFPLGCCFGL